MAQTLRRVVPDQPSPAVVACAAGEPCPAASACAPHRSPICAGVEKRHAEKLALCDLLEAIADSLPRAVDRHACLWIAAMLLPQLREAHDYEERVLFPAFAADVARAESVKRLQAEHIEDEAAAEELTETLLRIGHGGTIGNPEALGFMMRALFEAIRRHVAFEREHVLPIARHLAAASLADDGRPISLT